MLKNPEQYKLDFGKPVEQKPQPEMKVYERDECNACGIFFESHGGCSQCMNNKEKLNWLAKQKPKTKRKPH